MEVGSQTLSLGHIVPYMVQGQLKAGSSGADAGACGLSLVVEAAQPTIHHLTPDAQYCTRQNIGACLNCLPGIWRRLSQRRSTNALKTDTWKEQSQTARTLQIFRNGGGLFLGNKVCWLYMMFVCRTKRDKSRRYYHNIENFLAQPCACMVNLSPAQSCVHAR